MGGISLKRIISILLLISILGVLTVPVFSATQDLPNGTSDFPVNVTVNDATSGMKNLRILINGQEVANIDYTGEFPVAKLVNQPLNIPDNVEENVEVNVTFIATDRVGNQTTQDLYRFKILPVPSSDGNESPSQYQGSLDDALNSMDLNQIIEVVQDILESMLPNSEKKEMLSTVVTNLIDVDPSKDYTEDNRVRLMSAASIQEKVIALDVRDPKAYLVMIEIKRRLSMSNYLDYVKTKQVNGKITIIEVENKTYIPVDQATKMLGANTNIKDNVYTMDGSFGFMTDTGYLFIYPDGKVTGHPTLTQVDLKIYYGKMYVYKPDLEVLLDSDIKIYDIPEELMITNKDHWAYPYAERIINIYNIEVNTERLDDPAPIELQKRLFNLAKIDIPVEENMARFWPFYYMVQALNVQLDKGTDTYELLKEFDDACDTCQKANDTLAKAKKVGLLKGRSYPNGKVKLDIKEPITTGELSALILTFMELVKQSTY